MRPPSNCPYRELASKPCWNCPNYIPDTDECMLNGATASQRANAIDAATYTETYDHHLRKYEEERRKLLELPKEALVDLIIKRPTE